jgi:predicted kinase
MISDTIHLVLIGGLAGTGKTELALEVARQTRFAFYDKDLLNGPLVDELLVSLGSTAADRESSTYVDKVRPVEYACLVNAARESIGLGISAIATAPFLKEMGDIYWRIELQHDCEHALGRKVSVDYVWVHTSEEVMLRRLTNRRAARDRYKLENWEAYLATARQIRPLQPCFEVNCSANFETELRARDVIQRFRLV